MYNIYLDIYKFAISMPHAESAPLDSNENDKDAMVFLSERISRRYLWTYFFIYLVVYGLFILPQFVLQSLQPEETSSNSESVFIPMIIGYLVLAIFHGWIVYRKVSKYHKSNQTKVYRFGKLSYDDIYPKQLRRKLWLRNIIPFVYFTFAIVPIVTRIQHLIETKLFPRVGKQSHRKKGEGDPTMGQFALSKNFIESRLGDYSKDKAELLSVLKTLFKRRIFEITTDVQRISIILSTLGLATSLVAFMVKDPVGKILQEAIPIEIFVLFSIFALIIGVAIYYISHLQIQIGDSRDLSIVLDAIDVMSSEHRQNVVTESNIKNTVGAQ